MGPNPDRVIIRVTNPQGDRIVGPGTYRVFEGRGLREAVDAAGSPDAVAKAIFDENGKVRAGIREILPTVETSAVQRESGFGATATRSPSAEYFRKSDVELLDDGWSWVTTAFQTNRGGWIQRHTAGGALGYGFSVKMGPHSSDRKLYRTVEDAKHDRNGVLIASLWARAC